MRRTVNMLSSTRAAYELQAGWCRLLSRLPLNTIRKLFLFGISQIFTSIRGLILIPLITFGLNPTAYGIWSQASTTIALILPVLLLGLDGAAVRFFPQRSNNRIGLSQAFWSVFWTLVGLSAMLPIISFAGRGVVMDFVFGEPVAPIIVLLISGIAPLRALNTYLFSYLRATGQIETLAIWRAGREILLISGIAVLIYISGMTVQMCLTYWAITEIVTILSFVPKIFRELDFQVALDLSLMKEMLIYSLPLLLTSGAQWIINSSDRYFIVQYIDLETVGLYGGTYSMSAAISTMVIVTINSLLLPTTAKNWDSGQKQSVKHITSLGIYSYLAIALPVTMLTIIFARDIVMLMLGQVFQGVTMIVALVSTAYLISGLDQLFRNILLLAKRTRLIAAIIVLTATINIICNAVLIPNQGLRGAAIATFVSMSIKALLFLVSSRRSFTYRIEANMLFKIVLNTAIVSICVFVLYAIFPISRTVLRLVSVSAIGLIIYTLCSIVTGVSGTLLFDFRRHDILS